MHLGIGKYLDLLATVALAASAVFLLVTFIDVFAPPGSAIGTHSNNLHRLGEAAIFLCLLYAPTIFSVVSWPIYLRQKKAGERVFGWLPFVVIVSALWSYLVSVGVRGL